MNRTSSYNLRELIAVAVLVLIAVLGGITLYFAEANEVSAEIRAWPGVADSPSGIQAPPDSIVLPSRVPGVE